MVKRGDDLMGSHWKSGVLMFLVLLTMYIVSLHIYKYQAIDNFKVMIYVLYFIAISTLFTVSLYLTDYKIRSYKSSLIYSLSVSGIFYIVSAIVGFFVYSFYINPYTNPPITFSSFLLYNIILSIAISLIFFFLPSTISIFLQRKDILPIGKRVAIFLGIATIILFLGLMIIDIKTCSLNRDASCIADKAISKINIDSCNKAYNEQAKNKCIEIFCSQLNIQDCPAPAG